MSMERWFDDVTQKHIEGRFVDVDVVDGAATGINYFSPVMKSVLAIEVRCRSQHAGPQASTVQRIKPHNREEMIDRFPKAWEFYQATKAGKRMEPERATPLKSGVLGSFQISHLILNGFGSEERFLAMSDSDAISVFGERGIKLREDYRQALAADVGKPKGPQAPPSTPIEIKGPIDKLTFDILGSRAIAIYEEIAAWDDTAAWAYLGPKGQEVREFARAELAAKTMADRNPVDDGKAATVSDATSKAAPREKKSKSRAAE
jgi:hypothetical protein